MLLLLRLPASHTLSSNNALQALARMLQPHASPRTTGTAATSLPCPTERGYGTRAQRQYPPLTSSSSVFSHTARRALATVVSTSKCACILFLSAEV